MRVFTYERDGFRLHTLAPLTPQDVDAMLEYCRHLDSLPVPDALRSESWLKKTEDPLGFDRHGRPLNERQ